MAPVHVEGGKCSSGVLVNISNIGDCFCECPPEDIQLTIGVDSIVGKLVGIHMTEFYMIVISIMVFMLIVVSIILFFPWFNSLYVNCCGFLTLYLQRLLSYIPRYGQIFRKIEDGEDDDDFTDSFFSHIMFSESGFVILTGIMMGIILKFSGLQKIMKKELMEFNSSLFNILFTPPIFMKVSYLTKKAVFVHNIGLISCHMLFGTLFFVIFMGGIVYYANVTTISLAHCLVLVGLLTPVDPIATLDCLSFEKVNDRLFELVERESVLKHATGIIIYILFLNFSSSDAENTKLDSVGISFSIIGLGILKAFSVVILGSFVGFFIGLLGSLMARFSYKDNMHYFQPGIVYITCAAGYFATETFFGIGILGLVTSTLFMSRYVKYNLSKNSRATVAQILKLLDSIAKNVIFLYLGIAVVEYEHEFNWLLIIACNVGCFIVRFIFVYTTNTLWNCIFLLGGKEEERIRRRDSFIMAFSGIRGAISFDLAFVLPSDYQYKNLFVTTGLSVILFTVFFQGTLISAFVHLLKVQKAHLKLFDKVGLYKKIKRNLEKVLFLIPHPETLETPRNIVLRQCKRNYMKCVDQVSSYLSQVKKDFKIHTYEHLKREKMKEIRRMKKERKKPKNEEEFFEESKIEKVLIEHENDFCPDINLLRSIKEFLENKVIFELLYQSRSRQKNLDIKLLEKLYCNRCRISEVLESINERVGELYKYMRYKVSVIDIPREILEKNLGKFHVSEIPLEWVHNKISEEKSWIVKVMKSLISILSVLWKVVDAGIQFLVNREGRKKTEVKFSRATILFKSHVKANYNHDYFHGDEDLVFQVDVDGKKTFSDK